MKATEKKSTEQKSITEQKAITEQIANNPTANNPTAITGAVAATVKDNAMQNITVDTFAPVALIDRDKFAIVNTEQAKTACNGIANALEMQDKSTGAIAFYCARLASVWTNTTVKGYPKIINFLMDTFGLSKSQCYNYINAGDYIAVGTTDKGVTLYTDTWHCKDGMPDFNAKPFSCTALVRIAEFIGNDGNTSKRINFVDECVQNGSITPEMSVSQIVEFLNGNSPVKTDVKEKGKKKKSSKPTDNKPADNKPADNKPADNKPADNKPADNKPAENSNQLDETQLVFDRSEIEQVKAIASDIFEYVDTKDMPQKTILHIQKMMIEINDILTGKKKIDEAIKAVEE